MLRVVVLVCRWQTILWDVMSQVTKDGRSVMFTSCLLLAWMQLSASSTVCVDTQHGGSGGMIVRTLMLTVASLPMNCRY